MKTQFTLRTQDHDGVWRSVATGSLGGVLSSARWDWPHLARRVVSGGVVIVELDAGESWTFEQDEDAPRRVAS